MICITQIMNTTLGANTAGATAFSDVIDLDKYGLASDISVQIGATMAYTSSTLAITQQCSVDKINWYDPVNVYNVSVGAVCTQAAATTTNTRFVQLVPVLAPYIRFKVVSGSVCAVVLKIAYQEE